MVSFTVELKISSFDNSYMLDALEWIKTNYGTILDEAEAIGEKKEIVLNIPYDSYDDAVSTLIAFKTHFAERLETFNLKMAK